jgi:hypothetical protein
MECSRGGQRSEPQPAVSWLSGRPGTAQRGRQIVAARANTIATQRRISQPEILGLIVPPARPLSIVADAGHTCQQDARGNARRACLRRRGLRWQLVLLEHQAGAQFDACRDDSQAPAARGAGLLGRRSAHLQRERTAVRPGAPAEGERPPIRAFGQHVQQLVWGGTRGRRHNDRRGHDDRWGFERQLRRRSGQRLLALHSAATGAEPGPTGPE